jgi:DNA-binding FadR family transcriptional regulator
MADATPARFIDDTQRRPLRIHGTIARDLGTGIVSGVYPPGHLFETEIVASEALGVSRTAYREALRMLAAKGLVESRPKRGTRVSDPLSWNLLDPDILAWIFENDPPDALVKMLFEMRLIVEPRITALAAQRRTPEQLERMRAGVVGMQEHGLQVAAGRLADQDFHAALVESSGNVFLQSLLSGIVAAVAWTTIYKARRNQIIRDPVPDHRAVYEAVAAGDQFAGHAAMSQLIELAFQDIQPTDG